MSHCDQVIGPRVNPSCRAFDFTLYFQDLFFAITPNALLLLLLILPVVSLVKARDVVRRTRLVAIKAVSNKKALMGSVPNERYPRLCILYYSQVRQYSWP
jgi:hypothetical protein